MKTTTIERIVKRAARTRANVIVVSAPSTTTMATAAKKKRTKIPVIKNGYDPSTPPHPSLYPVLLASSYHDAITKDDEGDLPKLPSSPFPHETDQDDDDEEIDRLTCWVCERAFR